MQIVNVLLLIVSLPFSLTWKIKGSQLTASDLNKNKNVIKIAESDWNLTKSNICSSF